jgi:GH15 family glucan-1,4-alpha-glucosidase
MEEYQPIENYAVIGDLNTVGLVGLNGSIDFLCMPNFDSPSVFASLLDKDNGGYFRITPDHNDVRHKQLYLPDTNVLLTRFLARDGVGEITDFMPAEELYIGKELIRIVSCVRGTLTFSMSCKPRFDYARAKHEIRKRNESDFEFISLGSDKTKLRLRATVQLTEALGDLQSTFTLRTGERAIFMLEYVTDGPEHVVSIEEFANKCLFETIN